MPSASVTAWAETAFENLRSIRAQPEPGIPDDVIDSFERYILDWSDLAVASDTFTWTSEVDVAEVRRLASYWALLANAARTELDPAAFTLPSDVAQPFYDALVLTMTDVLAVDDEIHFADKFDEVAPSFDESRPPPNRDEGRTRILLVDDTEDIRLLFRIALQSQFEFEVIGEAANGQEALDFVAEACPDVILLDIMMPVMDGMTALPLLRDACPNARITVITTGLTDELRTEALAKGARAVVDKQISIDELKRVLASA